MATLARRIVPASIFFLVFSFFGAFFAVHIFRGGASWWTTTNKGMLAIFALGAVAILIPVLMISKRKAEGLMLAILATIVWSATTGFWLSSLGASIDSRIAAEWERSVTHGLLVGPYGVLIVAVILIAVLTLSLRRILGR